MPKFILKILVLGSVFFLMIPFSSCKLSFLGDSDEDIATECSTQLVEAINSSNVDNIAVLFSENSYTLGIDGTTLVNFFKNGIEIVPVEHLSINSEEEIDGNEIFKTLEYEICVRDLTTKEQYKFLFIQCVKNSLNNKDEGITTLMIYNVKDEDAFTNWWRSFDSSENPQGIQLCYFD